MLPAPAVLLADAHHLVRHGLRLLLESAGFPVVGEAGDAEQAIALVLRRQPNVLVLDLLHPGERGLDLLRDTAARAPRTRSLVVSSTPTSEAAVLDALKAGAHGYLSKASHSSELLRGIREVAAGRQYVVPPLSRDALEDARGSEEEAGDPFHSLTARGREVLQLAAEGLPSREIARRLGISPRTAEAHRARVMAQLGLRSRTDLIRFALRRGLVSLEPERRDRGAPRRTRRRRR